MATTTINISMPDSLRGEVDAAIAQEGYGNASEFFRDLVRRYLREREERQLEALLLEGIRSGEATPLTAGDFERIKERGLKRLRERGSR